MIKNVLNLVLLQTTSWSINLTQHKMELDFLQSFPMIDVVEEADDLHAVSPAISS